LPFGKPATLSGFRRRLYLDPLPPRHWVPNLPKRMQEIILHCLEIEADQRYATAAQLAFDLCHPNDVTLTARATRLKRAGLSTIIRRWWRSLRPVPGVNDAPTSHLAEASQILVAFDPDSGRVALQQAILQAVRGVIVTNANSRIIYVSVLEPDIASEEDSGREIANSLHTRRLVEMHHWAEELQLPVHRLRFHVLNGSNAASTLVEYARQNHIDQIIMGAHGSSSLRRILGSVSVQVVAEAPCTVTVVRLPRSQK